MRKWDKKTFIFVISRITKEIKKKDEIKTLAIVGIVNNKTLEKFVRLEEDNI
jgi:hypothetical protein